VNESEVIERAEALPDLYADRVRPEDLDGMRSMAGAGEWQELVDLVVASLGLTRAPVTAAERDELRNGDGVEVSTPRFELRETLGSSHRTNVTYGYLQLTNASSKAGTTTREREGVARSFGLHPAPGRTAVRPYAASYLALRSPTRRSRMR